MSLKQRSSFVLFMHRFVPVLTVLLAVFSILAINLRTTSVAEAATNSTINFQARLQSASGAIVPDGNYNIEFKLYSASSGGAALWTEDHYNSGSNGLRTVNGYFSTKLGSVTAFPSTINWDQELWLTMNVGGTTTGTPTLDGEMDPRLKLTAVPYAISAGQLQTTNGSYTSKLGIQAPTGGNQVFQIQDQGAAGTYNILTAPSGSDGYIKLQSSTPGTAQTGNLNISGTAMVGTLQTATIDAGSGNALAIGGSNATSVTIGAGSITTTIQGTASISKVLSGDFDSGSSSIALNIGNTNATTINVGTTSIARTINIGTGAAAQTVTIGSTSGTSSTTIQGGDNGIIFSQGTSGAGGYTFKANGGQTFLTMDYYGRTTYQALTSSIGDTFAVKNSAGTSILSVNSNDDALHVGGAGLSVGSSGIQNAGTLSFSGSTNVSYTTPGGANIPTKINIQNFDPGSYGQVIAMGIASSVSSTARVITVADGRTVAHQASIAVLSPNENQIGGFSWDGSNTVFGVKTSSDYIDLINSGGTGARIGIASGKQTLELGQGGGTNGALQFNNNTNTYYTAIQAPSVSASYLTNLPTDIGTAGQCLSVASVSSPTQQLGYSNCLTTGTGVQLQASTPGTQQTGNLNISGTGIFGAAVSTAQLTATGQSILGGGSNQTQLIIKANASQSNSNPFIKLQNSDGSERARINASNNGDFFFGYNVAGSLSGGAGGNLGFGSNALQSLTTGDTNTAIGASALGSISTGAGNVGIGSSAGSSLTADGNVAIGKNALGNVTSGYTNVAIGNGAGYNVTTASDFYNNTFIGNSAGTIDNGDFATASTLHNSAAIGAFSQVQADSTIALGGGGSQASKIVIGGTMAVGSNIFGAAPAIYYTGTASQSGSTISGSGTTWNSANGVRVGMRFIFANGTDGGTITAVNSTTSLTVNTSQTVSNQKYRIHNVGFQVKNTGDAYVQSTSTSAFAIQDANAVNLFNADTSTGTITLGSSGSGNYITFTAAGGLTAYGTSQHGKSIVYSPEYTNAVFDAAGDSSCSSANNGTLTSAYDATNYRNYYNWTSTQGTNQCYDVVLDVTLPNDFSSWNSSDPINLQALASNTSNAGYAIAVRNVTGAAWDGNYGSGYASPGSISTSWTDVASSAFSGTYNAGDRLSIKIRMTAKSSANLQLGNLTLNYNSKW